MVIQEPTPMACKFLEASDREFTDEDTLQGSKKLWGPFSMLLPTCPGKGIGDMGRTGKR